MMAASPRSYAAGAAHRKNHLLRTLSLASRVRVRFGGLHLDPSPKRKRAGVFQEPRPFVQMSTRLRLGLGLRGPSKTVTHAWSALPFRRR